MGKVNVSWTPGEEAHLVALYPTMTMAKLAESLGRSRGSVAGKVAELRAQGRLESKLLRRAWTHDDEAMVIDLYRTCTAEQIGEYLYRTRRSVTGKIKELQGDGRLDMRGNASRSPFHLPSTGILLARTCPKCGHMLDAGSFAKVAKDSPYRRQICRVCVNKSCQSAKGKYARALQEVSAKLATRHYEDYTSSELEELEDMSKSAFEVAISLGRTYFAVRGARQKKGMTSPRKAHVRQHWIIDFPEAMQALQEHFRELGKPVPEELWEWSDEDMAA